METYIRKSSGYQCRPLHQWPAEDQDAWKKALRSASPFEASGVAAQWSETSRRKTAKGYGVWLDWLDKHDLLNPSLPPEERATHKHVSAYYDELHSVLSSNSVHCRIQELGDALRAMAPQHDWNWIMRAAGRLRTQATPCHNKRLRMQPADKLAELGTQLMAEADNSAHTLLQQATQYRDGLIIALLAYRPLRGHNLAAMCIGQHLVEHNSTWSLVFTKAETKGKQALDMPFPAELLPYLKRYLEIYRPMLLTRDNRCTPAPLAALWVSRDATMLDQRSMFTRITRHTKAAFGQPVNPHLFRDCAATTTAIESPENIAVVPAVLGHSNARTSERYYNQAKALESGRRYQGTILALRATFNDLTT